MVDKMMRMAGRNPAGNPRAMQVDEDNNLKVVPAGGKAEIICSQKAIPVFEAIGYAYIGTNGYGGSILNGYIDVSRYSKRVLYVKNNYSNPISVKIAYDEDLGTGVQIGATQEIPLAPGVLKLYTSADIPLINERLRSMAVVVVGTVEAGKSVDVVVYGSP